VLHDGAGLFTGLDPGVCMTRYHSLVIHPDSVTEDVEVSAWSPDGAIMGIRHRSLPVYGVQFHPESVLSGEAGISMLRRFMEPQTMPVIGSEKPLARFG
jgi:anthranilate synthase component 2